jgi:hypothetical protein
MEALKESGVKVSPFFPTATLWVLTFAVEVKITGAAEEVLDAASVDDDEESSAYPYCAAATDAIERRTAANCILAVELGDWEDKMGGLYIIEVADMDGDQLA